MTDRICNGTKLSALLALGLLWGGAPVFGADPSTTLTAEEQRLADEHLRRFYGDPKDAAAMSQAVPKYSVRSGQEVKPNEFLRLEGPHEKLEGLERLAQAKSTERFRSWYCRNFLERRFPGFECDPPAHRRYAWSTAEDNDRVDALADTWIPREEIVWDLDALPTSGKTELPLWSDDYWRTAWGGTSYRYQEKKSFYRWREAIEDYAQPLAWALHGSNPFSQMVSESLSQWSPAEKYDLTVGDDDFSLTHQQKKNGERSLLPGGIVEGWVGICHGWAAAALMAPKAEKKVVVKGRTGVDVPWLPHDVRAIVSLAWANGTYANNYAGSKCRPVNPRTYSNGRLVDQECFDANPATYHLALGNLVGKAKLSFIMDNTYDYQIWNQPIVSYQFTYFDPMAPTRRSASWRDVAVDYDGRFKSVDRFQNPPTRGIRAVPADDGGIRKVVGVMATVVYLAEVFPRSADTLENALNRVTFFYDLELEEQNGRFVPRGGEWHQNAHPDFLWLPRREEMTTMKHDEGAPALDATRGPEAALTQKAKEGSAAGYPLCRVLEALLKGAAEGSKYECK